jgi:DNA adenine methylase
VWRAPDVFNKIKKIATYKERMKNTRILNSDYRAVIAHYDSPKTFFYLDPPYPKSGSSALYEHSNIDYEEMRDILAKIRGRFILSIDDTPIIRKLYKGFKIKKIKIIKTANAGIGQKQRTELLISN